MYSDDTSVPPQKPVRRPSTYGWGTPPPVKRVGPKRRKKGPFQLWVQLLVRKRGIWGYRQFNSAGSVAEARRRLKDMAADLPYTLETVVRGKRLYAKFTTPTEAAPSTQEIQSASVKNGKNGTIVLTLNEEAFKEQFKNAVSDKQTPVITPTPPLVVGAVPPIIRTKQSTEQIIELEKQIEYLKESNRILTNQLVHKVPTPQPKKTWHESLPQTTL